MDSTTIKNVRIFDGEKLTASTNVIIKDGHICGLTDRGTIAVGKRADLVLVDGDPTQDISACRNIQKVWVKGLETTL